MRWCGEVGEEKMRWDLNISTFTHIIVWTNDVIAHIATCYITKHDVTRHDATTCDVACMMSPHMSCMMSLAIECSD